MEEANALDVRDLTVSYGRNAPPAIDRVSASVPAGRTLSIVGPSGAGKSTLLRAICGLVRVDSGDVCIGGRSVLRESPQRRRAAMVFASDALVRTLTIRENLRMVAASGDRDARIEELAEVLGVGAHLSKHPAQLSTGERQRVAIARAVLSDPLVLLLDEPLAPLDPDLRIRVRDEIVHVRERFSGPIVFVTHDHSDAMAVADDLLVMIDGRIEDLGDPQRVYDKPRSERSATFVGARPMNILSGAAFGFQEETRVGFRPERARLASDEGSLRGQIVRVERTGPDVYLHLATAFGLVVVRASAAAAPERGEFFIAVDPADICIFPAADA